MANLMLSVMGACAEFERELIHERQREGIALAKQRVLYRGRKKALTSEQRIELHPRVGAGEQKTALAQEFCMSREALQQYLGAGVSYLAVQLGFSFHCPSSPPKKTGCIKSA